LKTTVKLTRKEIAANAEAAIAQQKKDTRKIRSFAPETWKKIENWGRESGNLSQHLQSYCFTISGRVRKNSELEPLEISNGIKILDIAAELAPELLVPKEIPAELKGRTWVKLEVTLDVIAQAVLWDKKNKKLKTISYTFLAELASGKKQLNEQNRRIASMNLDILQKCGFEYKAPVPVAETEEVPA
jgi:hypothetical protein